MFSDYFQSLDINYHCLIEPSTLFLRLFNDEFSYMAGTQYIILSLQRPNSSKYST